ncbi:hypothetical protein A9239_03415 [Methanosarcina sp. A14]|nr:hypothetical protein A9239_03415 [Methanosarcina sp. A14]
MGKIPAVRRPEKYILTELNWKKSLFSIRKPLPKGERSLFIKKALRRASYKSAIYRINSPLKFQVYDIV